MVASIMHRRAHSTYYRFPELMGSYKFVGLPPNIHAICLAIQSWFSELENNKKDVGLKLFLFIPAIIKVLNHTDYM